MIPPLYSARPRQALTTTMVRFILVLIAVFGALSSIDAHVSTDTSEQQTRLLDSSPSIPDCCVNRCRSSGKGGKGGKKDRFLTADEERMLSSYVDHECLDCRACYPGEDFPPPHYDPPYRPRPPYHRPPYPGRPGHGLMPNPGVVYLLVVVNPGGFPYLGPGGRGRGSGSPFFPGGGRWPYYPGGGRWPYYPGGGRGRHGRRRGGKKSGKGGKRSSKTNSSSRPDSECCTGKMNDGHFECTSYFGDEDCPHGDGPPMCSCGKSPELACSDSTCHYDCEAACSVNNGDSNGDYSDVIKCCLERVIQHCEKKFDDYGTYLGRTCRSYCGSPCHPTNAPSDDDGGSSGDDGVMHDDYYHDDVYYDDHYYDDYYHDDVYYDDHYYDDYYHHDDVYYHDDYFHDDYYYDDYYGGKKSSGKKEGGGGGGMSQLLMHDW